VASNMDIIWVSLDPVNPAIAPYPPPFNQRLEEAYQKFNPSDASSQRCVLGPDYFNSTIYFQKQGEVRRCPQKLGTLRLCGPSYLSRVCCLWAVHKQRLRLGRASATLKRARMLQAAGKHFQTTPAVNYGPRGGCKPAGYCNCVVVPV